MIAAASSPRRCRSRRASRHGPSSRRCPGRKLVVEINGGVDFFHDLGRAGRRTGRPTSCCSWRTTLGRPGMSENRRSAARRLGARRRRLGGRRGGRLLRDDAADPASQRHARRPRRRSPPPRAARAGRGRRARRPIRAARRPLTLSPTGAKLTLADFHGRDDAAQPVGDLVRAVPHGNARARQAAGRAAAPDFEVVAVNIDTARLDARRPSSRKSGSRASRATPIRSADAFETLRLAGKALGLPTTMLIDPMAARSASWRARRTGIRPTRWRQSRRWRGRERAPARRLASRWFGRPGITRRERRSGPWRGTSRRL